MSKKRYPQKLVAFLAILLAVGIIILELIVHFNPGIAANFTDHVLRPILGNTAVGFLEKNFFNLNDKIQQVTNKTGSSNVPELLADGASSQSPIPPLPDLPKVKGEGVWHNKPLKEFPNKEVISTTFIRPDPARAFAYVTLVKMNMNVFKLGIVAGTKQPGGPVGNYGSGKVPNEIVSSGRLVAAFDGGFQYRDGEYGMIAYGKTYLPLKYDIGTIVGYDDGSLRIISYHGQDLGKNVTFIRQNCPILIENGQVFALNEKNKKLWGRTFNADIYTMRSGVGITSDGNLIFAAGNNLSPETLAGALKMGGAKDAIQLDINPFWVRFNIFEPNGQGGYSTSTLIKSLKDGSNGFLNGYAKDFFFVYKNPNQP